MKQSKTDFRGLLLDLFQTLIQIFNDDFLFSLKELIPPEELIKTPQPMNIDEKEYFNDLHSDLMKKTKKLNSKFKTHFNALNNSDGKLFLHDQQEQGKKIFSMELSSETKFFSYDEKIFNYSQLMETFQIKMKEDNILCNKYKKIIQIENEIKINIAEEIQRQNEETQ